MATMLSFGISSDISGIVSSWIKETDLRGPSGRKASVAYVATMLLSDFAHYLKTLGYARHLSLPPEWEMVERLMRQHEKRMRR